MKKLKIMSIFILALILICAFSSSTVVNAATPTEVSTYDELTAAVEAGEDVKLVDNITTTDKVLTISKSLTIDLNGCTYSGAEPSNINKAIIITGEGVTVTIKDSGSNGKITTTDAGTGTRVISLENKATLILESGTITNNNPTAQYGGVTGVYATSGTTFNMKGGKIDMKKAKTSAYGVFVYGAKFVLDNGTINNESGNGISSSQGAEIIINNGTIETANRPAISGSMGADTVTINGGTITSTSGSITQGQNNILNITAGTFNGSIIQNGTANISGGTIVGDITAKMANKLTLSGNTRIEGNIYATNAKITFPATVTVTGIIEEKFSAYSDFTDVYYYNAANKKVKKVEWTVTPASAVKGTEIVIKTTKTTNMPVDEQLVGYTVYNSDDPEITVPVTKNAETGDYTFVMPDYTVKVKPNIEKIKYNITVTPKPGLIVTEGNNVSVILGTSQELNIKPEAGYELGNVTVDGTKVELVDGKLTLENVLGDKVVDVELKKIQYELTIDPVQGTTIDPSGKVTVEHGDNKEISISANEGYELVSVKVDGVEKTLTNGKLVIENVTANMDIKVVAQVKTQKITINKVEGATIEPNGVTTVKYGENKEISITANEGYELVSVKVNGKVVELKDGKLTLNNIKEDKEITVEVKKKVIVYNIIEGNNVKLEVTNDKPEQELTIKIDADYSLLAKVYLDGVELTKEQYTVKSGSTIITLVPEFLATLGEGEHTLLATYSDGGTATATFSKKVETVEETQKTEETEKKEETTKTDLPQTGDNIIIICASVILLVVLANVIVTLKSKKKK